MGTIKLNIGKIPISKGEYQEGTTYQRLNQVTMLGSTYQSKIDDNTSAPAQMGADGAVENINTDKWLCIAVGNVSAARKVVYNNETSGLEAGNVQEAIDEVGSKVSDLSDNVSIKDEEGTVVETPFRYIQNEEFIFAKVDAEDKLLFGIQWDGTPVFGKTSAVEDRLQTQVNLLADKVTAILGDDNTTSAIDTLKELKDFFAGIDNTQTLTSILANLNAAIDKVAIKDEAGEIQDTPFRVIENEEFIMAVVDSEDRLLFGIYRDSGKPYFPLNEMYHVEQNEEFFAVWVDAANHVLFGIRRDGEIIGEIHAVNALKQVISQLQSDLASLQEKVGTIDTNLKELLDVFSLQENPEYLAVETDEEGKILSATNPDGSHYIHNAKSETIPEEFSHIEDPEGRTEITTDAEDKILGYRDSEGTRHEHKISAKHLELSDEAAKEVNEAFKSAGIKMDNPSDFSKESHVELPIPRIAAHVRIYALKLPTTKTDDIEAEIEYNDKDGNYFRKPVILNSQGSSSMNYIDKTTGEKGNLSIDLNDGSEIKFGDFPTQDSFHLKKYYIDAFRGQCIVGYWLMEEVYQSRTIGAQYPYDYIRRTDSLLSATGKINKDFFTGAKCHPDGFPIEITFINKKTGEETWIGVYAWNLKKSKEVYYCDKKNASNIILDGVISKETLFGGTVQWNQFEIRNPKSLKTINGSKYDGDNPQELSDTDEFSKKVKDAIVRLSNLTSDLALSNTQETFKKYLITDAFIDYILVSDVLYNFDGYTKNWIWCTWDGLLWCPTLYDVDSIFGSHWNGTHIMVNTDKYTPNDERTFGFRALFADEIKQRYAELRNKKVFDVDNIVSLLSKWLNMVGYDNLKKDLTKYNETPSYRDSKLNEQWMQVPWGDGNEKEFDESTTYAKDQYCKYLGFVFQATTSVTGVPPVKELYSSLPNVGGCYNSMQRVSNWLTSRIKTLDNIYKYNI